MIPMAKRSIVKNKSNITVETVSRFMHMGLAMRESISSQLGKSAVLSYQSLARYR